MDLGCYGSCSFGGSRFGVLNYDLYVKRLAEQHPNIPLIIEHLDEGNIERAKRFTDETLRRMGV